MKKMILVMSMLLIGLANATDKVGMTYNTKAELSGAALKVYVFKVEHLTGKKIEGNITEDKTEVNLLIEPDFRVAKYEMISFLVSPLVGVSLKSNLITQADPTVKNPGHALYSDNKSTRLITGAFVGVNIEPREKLNLSAKIGAVNNGSGYKKQIAFGISFGF